jgi:hypothetical protein
LSDTSIEQSAHNRRAARLRAIRQLHFWAAAFVAPSLLLFALTGMLQLFKLHEAEGGYRPLPVIEKLGQVHIHQTYALRPVRARPPEADCADRRRAGPAGARRTGRAARRDPRQVDLPAHLGRHGRLRRPGRLDGPQQHAASAG